MAAKKAKSKKRTGKASAKKPQKLESRRQRLEPEPPAHREPGPLSLRQLAFIDQMPATGWDATKAAIAAGYSPKGAAARGSKLLADPRIQAAVTAKKAELAERSMITAERVLEELGVIGFADIADYVRFDERGNVILAFDKMPKTASRAIAEIKQKQYWEGKDDDAKFVTETRFKLHPKTPALNIIAQHLGMLVQRHQQLDKNGKPTNPPKALRVTFVRAKSADD